MEFRILGPLEVEDGGVSIPLGGPKQRAVLALLLLHRNEVVALDRLVDELWGADPPATAAKTLRVYASRLRKLVGERIESRAGGLVVNVEAGELDLDRLGELQSRGGFREALALFRGQPLADFAYDGWAQTEIRRLEELRLTMLEERIDLDLRLARHAELVGELEALVAAQPLRERFRAQLMLALYRSGRQAEALEAYQDARAALVEELGIDPGPELQRLETQILRQDPELAPPSPPDVPPDLPAPAPERPRPRERRRTVTVLAAELADVAALDDQADPEIVQTVTDRCFDSAAAIVREHGGTAEQPLGGTFVGVFGLPSRHDDDALRALRAAFALRDAVRVRVGVATGQVLVPADRPAAGTAFTIAFALRSAAGDGEVLADDDTLQAAQAAVRAEPIVVEGAAQSLAAHRILELVPGAASIARRLDAPLVGRERELERLSAAFDQAVRERTAVLFTLLGPAGIGKSRLASELAAVGGDRAAVLTGRCLSYGEGTTFRPLLEMVEQAAGRVSREAICDLAGGDPDREVVAERLAGALGQDGLPGSADETFWAARKLVQAVSRSRPHVLVFDDVHWAEPTLLDLIEYLADWTRDAPVLLLCLSRTELIDERPTWGGGRLNAVTMLLEPLAEEECDLLVDDLVGSGKLPAETRARILAAADGNPLFLEQMVAFAGESDMPDVVVPPTIEALLAARLDRLEPGERDVLERAAVEGKQFSRAGIVALADEPDEAAVDAALRSLFRKELVTFDESAPGDDAYRFRHILIRDVAYDSIPKRLRAALHERFAGWLERSGQELDEIVGYHLEQAVTYRRELGLLDGVDALAERAGARLAAAGKAAYDRDDMPAAAPLLSRACLLLPELDPRRRELLVDVGYALRTVGKLDDGAAALEEAVARSQAAGDERTRANAEVMRLWHRLQTGRGADARAVLSELEVLVPVFERLGDERGLATAWKQAGEVHHFLGEVATAEGAFRRAVEHARSAGRDASTVEATSTSWLMSTAATGPRPAAEAIALCEEILARAETPRLQVSALLELGFARGLSGDRAGAAEAFREAKLCAHDLGLPLIEATVSERAGRAALLAGDAETGESEFRACVEIVERLGALSVLSTEAAYLARALLDLGRDAEAERFADVSAADASDDDLLTQILLHGVRARILSRSGAHEEAETLAKRGVELAETTDMLDQHGVALLDLADVLERAGRPADAAAAAGRAVAIFGRKGAIVAAKRAEALRARLV